MESNVVHKCTFIIEALSPYTEEATVRCGEAATLKIIHDPTKEVGGPVDSMVEGFACKKHEPNIELDGYWSRVEAL